MKFEIESSIAKGDINLVLTPKKLKTRPNDFENIKNSPVPVVTISKPEEKPVPETYKEVEEKTYEHEDYYNKPEPEENKEKEISIDEIIKKRTSLVEEPKKEESEEAEMDDNIEFAYAGRVIEPEVSDEAIDRIKSLGDDYKGDVRPKVIVSRPEKEEVKYSEEDYLSMLKADCFSPRTKKYLTQKLNEYKGLLETIDNTKKEIEEIVDKYKMESEIASKLNAIKKETYGIMTWINSSDFKILKNEKTSAVNNLFKSYEDLFNENQQKFKKADEELEKTNEISSDLGRKEKEARETLQNLIKEKKNIVKDNFAKVENVIKLDKDMEKQSSQMAKLTGIDEVDNAFVDENRFDSLRRDE